MMVSDLQWKSKYYLFLKLKHYFDHNKSDHQFFKEHNNLTVFH